MSHIMFIPNSPRHEQTFQFEIRKLRFDKATTQLQNTPRGKLINVIGPIFELARQCSDFDSKICPFIQNTIRDNISEGALTSRGH